MISFIIHYRHDTPERAVNNNLIYEYYKSLYPTCQFVYVEDDANIHIANWVAKRGETYCFMHNTGLVKKCVGYNVGASLARHDILCFLDVDVVVSKAALDRAISDLSTGDSEFRSNLVIGYNGIAFYMTYAGKSEISKHYVTQSPQSLHDVCEKVNYELLSYRFDASGIRTGQSSVFGCVGNTNAVGGCLLTTKADFSNIGGFNPNFIGWGYEDNEIISRAKILGKAVTNCTQIACSLYHLPHESDVYRDKSAHAHYTANHAEVQKVEAMSKQELEQYIKTW